MEIQLAQIDQAKSAFTILKECKQSLDSEGIFQWTDSYPSIDIITRDIENQFLYTLSIEGECVGIINISEEQEPEYASIPWSYTTGNIMVIHRLAVLPSYQGQGIAGKLMDFAETQGTDKQYSSIRLDAYSDNIRVLRFYEKRGYRRKGEVFFPGRTSAFFCYEKSLIN